MTLLLIGNAKNGEKYYSGCRPARDTAPMLGSGIGAELGKSVQLTGYTSSHFTLRKTTEEMAALPLNLTKGIAEIEFLISALS